MTKFDFIEKAKAIHGNEYNYSKVEYKNNKTKIKIICSIHGEFSQTPSTHTKGSKCPNCRKNKKMTTMDFIKKASIIHDAEYDYSKVEYINTKTKVCIICHKHGEFLQTPENHLQGFKCSKCKGNFMNKEYFINLSNIKHDNKYNYHEVKYININSKVDIRCPIHGLFLQSPRDHVKGAGCKKCANQFMDLNLFIERSNAVHGNKFNYSKVIYVNTLTKVKINCPIHGDFNQSAGSHLNGRGCPKCKQSKGERLIENVLRKYNIKNTHNYKFDDCKDKRSLPFDFYLPLINTCIEYDGAQHFYSVDWFGGDIEFVNRQKRDIIKTKYCVDNKIKLIRISYLNFNHIENILIKKLNLKNET